MLALTCERAGVEDGMELLDLGCGWGSLTFWLAERYPDARVAGALQLTRPADFIEAVAAPRNLEVVTADANVFEPGGGSTGSSRSRCSSTCGTTRRSCEGGLLARAGRPALRPRLHPPALRVPVHELVDGEEVLHRRDHAFARPAPELPARPRAGGALGRRAGCTTRARARRGCGGWTSDRAAILPVLAGTYGPGPRRLARSTGGSSSWRAPSSGATATAPSGASRTTGSPGADGARRRRRRAPGAGRTRPRCARARERRSRDAPLAEHPRGPGGGGAGIPRLGGRARPDPARLHDRRRRHGRIPRRPGHLLQPASPDRGGRLRRRAGGARAGIAVRALRLACRFAFDQLGAQRIELRTHPDNAASIRVAEKAGFTREGIERSSREIRGQRHDSVCFSLLPED